MSFKRGTQYKVFITTENNAGAVVCTGSVAEASTESSGVGPNDTILGVGFLGSVTASTDTGSQFRNLEAIEPEWSWEDDSFVVFGQTRPLDNPIRKKWSVTLTKKGENKLLSKLADSARFGVTGSTPALFDGLDTMPDTTGYRVYVFDGTDFAVGFHGTITGDGYTETLGPDAVTVQSITIAGGLWSASIGETASGLSDSMDITQ
jgi:hypothetical protein